MDIIIGDIHLDMKHGDENFMEYQRLFFNKIYEFITKNTIDNVIFLGDIFTNKQTINFKVMDFALNIMEKISEHCEQIILINGNHVLYHKNSYEVDSVDIIFRGRDKLKITTFKEYHVLNDYVFINWKNTREEYIELFKSIENREDYKYIFGHFELFGFMLTRYAENRSTKSLTKEDIQKYFPNAYIISGHYHSPQRDDDVFYPGVPYELSWNEAGLKLGFYTLENNRFKFHKNKNIMYEQITVNDISDIHNYVSNNKDYSKYLKIITDKKELHEPINLFKDELDERGYNVSVINTFDLFEGDDDVEEIELELTESKSKNNKVEMNLGFIFKEYIYNVINIDDDLRDIVYEKFIKLYDGAKLNMTQNFEL